jgi:hypothetical protein
MQMMHTTEPSGDLLTRVLRKQPEVVRAWEPVINDRRRVDFALVREHSMPRRGVSDAINRWRAANEQNLERGLHRVALADMHGIPTHFGALYVAKIHACGDVEELGLASLRVVTDAGVAAIADSFGNTFENETLNFHGMGTGGTAEAASQTALVTELTTEYNPNSTRATGTQTTPTNVYQTIGTNTIDSGTPAITEHGIFSQAATGGGTMLDRSLFSAINLASGDGIQFTYQLTFTSGG